MSDRETMDTNVTAQTVKPAGVPVSNGTPGKVSGYSATSQPFEGIGIDSGDDSKSSWPPDQLAGQSPGWGSTENSPNR